MTAKLTFNDIENAELGTDKLSFDAGFSNILNSGIIDPTADSPVGALYINTASGTLFRKTAAGNSNWVQISSVTSTVLINRYRNVTQNSAVTATDATSASIGDLVGYCGAGAWATSGLLSLSKQQMAGAGSQNAGLVAGGVTNGGTATNVTELFNGSAWAASGTLSLARNALAGAGSQNAGLVAGGVTNAGGQSSVAELFNGSAWTTGGALSVPKSFLVGMGSQNAGLVAGGTTGVITNVTELFNGSTWTIGGVLSTIKISMATAGSQNAGLVAGGTTGSNTNVTELFNGSTWLYGGVLSTIRSALAGAGSQNSAFVAGGNTGTSTTNITELFNGSAWAASGTLNLKRSALAGMGSQNAGLVAGVTTGVFTVGLAEIHTQTTFRKLSTKNYPEAKNIGILATASSVLLQGTNTSVTYVANKYLVLNRYNNSTVTNNTSLTSLSLGSVLGTAPTMTYNLASSADLLSVVPGMMLVVTAGGGTPASAGNVGTFIISRVVSPTSFEVQNSTGISQNPATGTMSVLSTMLAVDSISPQDIVIGKTDAAGLLTIQRPLVIGSLTKRLK